MDNNTNEKNNILHKKYPTKEEIKECTKKTISRYYKVLKRLARK